MSLKVVELHHHAVRVPPSRSGAAEVRRFYTDVLGLGADDGPSGPPGQAGNQINAGPAAQIHLIGLAGMTADPGTGIDPTAPHVALAVLSIAEARAELDRLGIRYRTLPGTSGPESQQLFLNDPAGNLVELHQLGTCRCTARSRNALAGHARVSGTVLFADMRGFTTVAEQLSPDQVVPLLNEYFSLLSKITAEYGGTVFHIAGDGLMAGFGVPRAEADASIRAVAAARRMISGFDRLAGDWKSAAGARDRHRHRHQCRRIHHRRCRRARSAELHADRRHRQRGRPAGAARARGRSPVLTLRMAGAEGRRHRHRRTAADGPARSHAPGRDLLHAFDHAPRPATGAGLNGHRRPRWFTIAGR